MVKFIGTFNFPYQMLIHCGNESYNTSDSEKSMEVCNKWCIDNCKSMWLITERMVVNLYAPNPHNSLITGQTFEPSRIREHSVFLISFEDETEAMAFKISFEGEDK